MKCKFELFRGDRIQMVESFDFLSKNQTVKLCRPNCQNPTKSDKTVLLAKCHARKINSLRITVVRAPSKTIVIESIKLYCQLATKWTNKLEEALSRLHSTGFYGCADNEQGLVRYFTKLNIFMILNSFINPFRRRTIRHRWSKWTCFFITRTKVQNRPRRRFTELGVVFNYTLSNAKSNTVALWSLGWWDDGWKLAKS